MDLTEPRWSPGSSLIGEDEWFITGGETYVYTTEVRSGGFPVPGPEIPDGEGMFRSCQVTIDDNNVFLLTSLDGVYILDWETKEWSAHVRISTVLSMRTAWYFSKLF